MPAPRFREDLVVALERQYDLFEPYRMLCELHDIGRSDLRTLLEQGEAWRVPAVPADWFKRAKSEGLFQRFSRPSGNGAWLLSSSTSGDYSYTWRTPADMDSIRRSFDRMWRSIAVDVALVCSPDPDVLARSGSRVAIDDRPTWPYATVPLRQANASYPEVHWLVQPRIADGAPDGTPVLEFQHECLLEQLERAEAERRPVGVCMSVLILYPALQALPRAFDLGRNAYIHTGAGGWDGKKGTAVGEPIHKPTYVRDVAERLGIPEDAWATNIRDGYGTTENGKVQSGGYSREWEDFVYELGDDVLLYLIDPVTEQPVGAGGRGFPRFLSPYGVEGFAGACVQQQDLITAVATNPDGSVRAFTHIARSTGPDDAGSVGCALTMAEEVRA